MITHLIRSSGATSFVAVFNLLRGYLKGEGDQVEKPGGLLKKLLPGSSKEKATEVGDKKKNKIFVFFMTDGCDTCSDPKSIMMVIVTILMKSYFFSRLILRYCGGYFEKVARLPHNPA